MRPTDRIQGWLTRRPRLVETLLDRRPVVLFYVKGDQGRYGFASSTLSVNALPFMRLKANTATSCQGSNELGPTLLLLGGIAQEVTRYVSTNVHVAALFDVHSTRWN